MTSLLDFISFCGILNLTKYLGGKMMKKEEILEKSKVENKKYDERERQGLVQAIYISYSVGIIATFFFYCIALFRGQPSYSYLSIMWLLIGTSNIGRYFKVNKKTSYMVAGIICLIAGCVFAIFYILNI